MKTPSPRPPRWAQRLLRGFCAPPLLDELEGDLEELFRQRLASSGLRRARWRYVRDVFSLLRPFVLRRKPDHSPRPRHTDMLSTYFKIAFRTLVKERVSTLINLLGLTMGVTACLVIYLTTRFELSYDTFHPDRERIYRVVGNVSMGANPESRPVGFVPRAAPKAIREEVTGLETVAAFHTLHSEVLVPNNRGEVKRFVPQKLGEDQAQIILADPAYFDIFRYDWLAGSPAAALQEPNKVVLTEAKASMYFGAIPLDSMLGRQVIYRESIRATVSGIVREWSGNTDFTFTDFLSAATIQNSDLKREINLEEWNDIWSASQTFVKLAEGTTPADVEARFRIFAQKHFGPARGTGDFRFVPGLQPLSDLHFNAQYTDNYSRKAHLPTLYGLMGVALFILLIAAINFINLATAQSVGRTREVGMRKVLGSTRQSLLAQFMSETLLLTTLAVGVALLLTQPMLTTFRSFLPEGVELHFRDPRLVVFLVTLTVITTLLAGLYPAWILSAHQPARALKGETGLMGNQRGYLRKALITFQFTVSLVFIIGTLMVSRQLHFMRDKDLGFTTDAVVLINTPDRSKAAVLAGKIGQLTGVHRVAMQWAPPMSDSYMLTRVKYRGTSEMETEVSAKIGDENYVPLYQLRLLAGRNVQRTDQLRELIINQTYARLLGFKQPAEAIGKVLNFNGKECPIVGVVADFHENTLHAAIKPTCIVNIPDLSRDLGVKLATQGQGFSEAKVTLAEIEKRWKTVFPDEKFSYTFLDDSLARLYEKEQKTSQLVNLATGIAILISCLGLFGLATFSARQRAKEIGVRKVLGASVGSIVALLSADFVRLVLLAMLLASPVAWWATDHWLQGFAFRVGIEWWVFALAGLLAIGIALLTVSFQSVRAARVNPVKSLRTD